MNDAHSLAAGLRQVCHDIRQPIAGVLAVAGALLADEGLPEDTRTRLRQIVELAEWQSDVIEHWLLAAGGGGQPDAGHADVVRVINEAAAAERVVWAGELILVWPPEPVFTLLDPVILRRVVANLLANATRAAGTDGMVAIEVGRRDGRILLVVEDNGPGFGCLPGRYGLGLSAAARQAAEHRGRLECGRGNLGGGLVSLWLPLAEADSERGIADATCAV